MGSRRIRIEHCRTINSGERILPIRPLKICPMGCRASTHIFHFILPLKFGLAVTPFLFNNILASEYNSFVFYNILASHGLEFSSSFVFNDIPASFPVFSTFLGFTHISGNNRRGYFTVKRRGSGVCAVLGGNSAGAGMPQWRNRGSGSGRSYRATSTTLRYRGA